MSFKAAATFECPVEPQSNILCFRVKGIHDGHLAPRDRLLARGNYYVSTSSLNGRRYLRSTLTNPATGLDEIKGLVHEIRELIAGDKATPSTKLTTTLREC